MYHYPHVTIGKKMSIIRFAYTVEANIALFSNYLVVNRSIFEKTCTGGKHFGTFFSTFLTK